MKLATKLRKQAILNAYMKDFPGITINDWNSGVTVTDNGRIIFGIDEGIKFGKSETSRDYLPLGIGTFIHNSLIGIDDNNGWILIEPDGSNLPQPGLYKVCANGNVYECFLWHTKQWISDNIEISPSHYKPIKEELKPIY